MTLPTGRYRSLDVFRGLTIAMMILVNTPGSWQHIYAPLRHAEWHGYTPTDLVFPFFLVAVGLSMSFVLPRYRSRGGKAFYSKVIRRVLLIFFIGLALTAFPFYNKDYSHLRILGVLQRIALAYGLAAVWVYHLRQVRLLIITSLLVLVGYWLLLWLAGGPDPYSLTHNLPRQLDLLVLGANHMWHGHGLAFDPEGLLSTLPAAVSVVSGYLLGLLIQQTRRPAPVWLAGALLLAAGYLWSLAMPINKSLWTSSYVLVSSGIAALVLGLLIYLIDIGGLAGWAKPFEIFGMNPLAVFILSILWVKIYFMIHIGDRNMYGWLYHTVFEPIGNPTFGSLLFALFHVAGCWLVAWLLYRKQIVIKV